MSRTRNELILADELKSKSKKTVPKIGYISSFIPEEILYAAGLNPYRISGDGIDSYSKAQTHMHRNMCSYITSCLEEGCRRTDLTGLIIGHTCDAARRLYDVVRHYLPYEYVYFLDIPRVITPLTLDYFEHQIVDLKQSIETFFCCKISTGQLQKSVELCNESRKLLYKLFLLRQEYERGGGISESENIHILKSFYGGDKSDLNKRLTRMIDSIKKSVHTREKNTRNILLCGSFFDNQEIISCIERYGVKIIAEDTEFGISNFENTLDYTNDILHSIASYYLHKTICSRVLCAEERFKHLSSLMTSHDIQGVIYYSLKFCDNNLLDYPYIKKKLDKKNIPCLFIEGERQSHSIEQSKTRIGAFLEELFI